MEMIRVKLKNLIFTKPENRLMA